MYKIFKALVHALKGVPYMLYRKSAPDGGGTPAFDNCAKYGCDANPTADVATPLKVVAPKTLS